MAKNVLKSNNSIVLAGPNPAFKTSTETGTLMAGVQSVSFGFTHQREKLNQVGSYTLAVDHINRMPDVDLSIDYIYTPELLNEDILNLVNITSLASGSLFMDGLDNSDRNFYIINAPDQEDDCLDKYDDSGETTYLKVAGDEVVKFGNAFLTNYSLSFAVGQIPVVSTSYKCSNIETSIVDNSYTKIPAINLNSGTTNGAGSLGLLNINLSGDGQGDGSGFFDFVDRRTPSFIPPSDIGLELENLQIGGAPLSGDVSVQSFAFDVPINRVDLFGLGSNYPYGRKAQYPIRSSVEMQILVSGFATGQLYDSINQESYYDFNLSVENMTGYEEISGTTERHLTYYFENMRLESCNYSMAVNDTMQYSLGFSYQVCRS